MKGVIRFAVNHSLFVNLLSIFVVVAGILSLLTLRREAFPNVNYDVVMVQTDYFGSPPEEIEKLITIEIENELKEVSGIDEMNSVSSENISMIILQLDPDEKDKTKVVNDIQRAVDRVDDLPEDAEDPIVNEMQSKDFPVINVSLSGPFEERELQRIARKLEILFLDLQDVARVDRTGWRDREMWVEVRPEIVDKFRLSLEDVILALRNKNLNIPGGTLTTASGDFLVRTIGEFETAKEIEEVIVRANDSGNWIKVKDIATVQDTFEDDDVIEKTFAHKAITLTIVKKEKGDIIRLVEDIKKVAEEFKKDAPEDLKISYFDDFSYYVKRRLNVLTNNGTIGLILVVFALLIFLTRSVAVMTALGIPIAVAMTFFFMNTMGLTINLITMFALIMVLGLVVDDAIVVSENVYRHIEMGKKPKQAAIDGTSEVALPVITTVLTTIVAFVPLFFMSGIMGKFISVIPVIVIVALTASLVESLVVLPSHIADFSGKKKANGTHSKEKHGWYLRVENFYMKRLTWILRHKYVAILLFVGVFFAAIALYVSSMRFVLFPQGLIEEFIIKAKAPIGTSLEEMERRIGKMEDLVLKLPKEDLDNFVTRVGIARESVDDPNSERGSHIAQIQVYLTPEKTKGRRNADDIISELRKGSKPFGDLYDELTFDKVRAGPPVGKPVAIRLRGDEFDVLEGAAERVKEKLHTIEGVLDIKDDFDEGKTEIRIVVNEEKASQAFLSIRDIATTVRNALDGGVATKIRKTDEEIDVIVRYPESEVDTREIFDYIQIPNRFGSLVPLKKIAKLEENRGYNAIKHFDRKRLINVTASVEEKVVTPIDVAKQIGKFSAGPLAEEFPAVTVSFGGEQEETQKSMQDFLRAIFLALFLIFIILAANFNSIIRPIIVMAAIPFGLVGVIFTFFFHGQPLSFMAMLGMIGLTGVVVNDSIVLVDFIASLRREGKERLESIVEAGRLRLRPVILTTFTTMVGLMPVAYGIGGSDPFLKPMALAISWGLVFATVLTLLLIPCLYSISDDVKDLLAKLFKQSVSANENA